MRFIYLSLVLFSSSYLAAQPLQSFVEEKTQIPVLEGALWGGIAMHADDSSVLFQKNESTRLTPASTLKLITTAAALEAFGPDHRFETKLYAQTVPDNNGVLHGNLYLQGAGDPTLGSPRVTGAESRERVLEKWVDAIKKAGIKRVEGSLIADVSAFEGPSISPKVNWENMGNYFAAPATPLCFNDNLFEIHFKPQLRANQPTEIDYTSPKLPEVTFENFVTTDGKSKKDNAYVYGAPGQYHLKIFGTIPTTLNGFTIKAALPDPALFALQALQEALEKEHITLTGKVQTVSTAPDYATYQLLHTYQSPKLKDIVVIVNKRSFNLYADMLLRQLALAEGKKGSIENGLAVLQHFLKKNKISTATDTVLYDGSGLARDNLLTPKTLANVLVYMSKSPYFEDYYKSLATPDDRGDLLVLRRFLKPFQKVDQVRVKGGTIDGVKAAAGYVKNEQGRLIVFVLMANNLASKDESLLRMHESILKQLLQTP